MKMFVKVLKVLPTFCVVILILVTSLVLHYFLGGQAFSAEGSYLHELLAARRISDKRVDVIFEMIKAKDIADLALGDTVYQNTMRLLKQKKFYQAEEQLRYIVKYYPKFPSIKEVRRLLGEITLDKIFSEEVLKEKSQPYTVKKGDSVWKIVKKHKMNHDFFMMLNNLNRADRLYPGKEVKVQTLSYDLEINLRAKRIVVLEEGNFIKSYDILNIDPALLRGSRGKGYSTIKGIESFVKDKRTIAGNLPYFKADKSVVLKTGLAIKTQGVFSVKKAGVELSKEDLEELVFLLRAGNKVVIIS